VRVIWLCPLPREVAAGRLHPDLESLFQHPSPWITSHLPAPRDLEIHVACLLPGGKKQIDFEYSGASWHLMPAPPSNRSAKFFIHDHEHFKSLFNEIKPSLVHSWGTEDSNAMVAQKLLPAKTLVGIQGLIHKCLFIYGIKGFIRRLICSFSETRVLVKSRHVVCESNFARDGAAVFARKAEIYVVPHSIRHEFLNSEISIKSNKKVVFIGNICPAKGIEDALKAFDLAAPLDWTMDIIGEGSKEYIARIMRKIEKLGSKHRIRLLGYLSTSDLILKMQQASIFLLPTRIDTGPTSLKEAICMGLWPVCFDNSGPSEIVRRFRWGSLATNLNVFDLAEKLKLSIQNQNIYTQDRRRKLASEARSYFSPDSAWAGLMPIYRKIISE
jgi:glycosyltransferase involved in cell wall biosynthesis